MASRDSQIDSLALTVLTRAVDAMLSIVEKFGPFADQYSRATKKQNVARDFLTILADMRKLVWKMQDLRTLLSTEEHH
jgi:hypothetical protein